MKVIKKCIKCKKYKSLDEFFKRSDSNDGLRNECKVCSRKRNKKYRDNNKEKLNKLSKIWRDNNKNYIKEQRLKNSEILSDRRKEYYQNNKFKENKRNNTYYKDNATELCKKTKLYRQQNKTTVVDNKIKYRIAVPNYETYISKLTIDESPRLAKDGISLEVKCRYCGKYFMPTNAQVGRRVQSLNGTMCGDNFLYCSNNCKKACPVYNQKLYPKGFKKASSREVDPLIRQLCFERDNWTCQICGATQKETPLHCHHVEGYTQNPRLGNDVVNTITLCKTCHKEVHKLPGCGYYELRCN